MWRIEKKLTKTKNDTDPLAKTSELHNAVSRHVQSKLGAESIERETEVSARVNTKKKS